MPFWNCLSVVDCLSVSANRSSGYWSDYGLVFGAPSVVALCIKHRRDRSYMLANCRSQSQNSLMIFKSSFARGKKLYLQAFFLPAVGFALFLLVSVPALLNEMTATRNVWICKCRNRNSYVSDSHLSDSALISYLKYLAQKFVPFFIWDKKVRFNKSSFPLVRFFNGSSKNTAQH